jgi:hypothetical protein
MATKKLPSPTEDDIKRIAETVMTLDSTDSIVDKQTFLEAYKDYLGEENDLLDNKFVERKVFSEIREKRPEISSSDFFKDARGGDFERDRKTTAKTVVTTRREYNKRGASHVDLKGYDVKKKYDKVGFIHDKIVYSRRDTISIKGHQIVRYRDNKGRFVRLEK